MRISTILFAVASMAAAAQYSPVAIYSRMPALYSATMANMAPLWKQQAIVALYKGVKPVPGRAAAPAGPAAVARVADFSFPYQRRWVAVDEMAGYLADSPKERKEAGAQLALLIQTIAEDLKQGGTPYDVSRAFTFFTATMFSILQPDAPLDQAGMDRLLRQFRVELLDAASMQASPAERTQRQWETLIGIGGLMLMGHEQALQQRNEQAVRALRESAALGLAQLFRVEAGRLRLDPRAEMPLSLTGSAEAMTAPVVAAPAVAARAPVAPAPTEAATGDVVRLGHYHTISGVHPAELRLGADGLSFDPLGNTCNQAALRVPWADVQVGAATVNGTGETLLNLRIRDPRNPKKTLNFNFATGDSRNENVSGMVVVQSPEGAMDRLRQVAERLRARGAGR